MSCRRDEGLNSTRSRVTVARGVGSSEPFGALRTVYQKFGPSKSRPGAGDVDGICAGCVSSGMGNCDFNNNGHTPPYHRVGVQLLIYR